MDLAKVKEIADNVDALKGRMDAYAGRKADAAGDSVLTFPKAAALAEKYKNENLQVAKQAMKLDGQSPANIARVVELINASKSRGDAEMCNLADSKKADATGKWEVVVDYKDARDVTTKHFDKEFDAMRFADEKSDLKEVFEVTVYDPNGKQKKF